MVAFSSLGVYYTSYDYTRVMNVTVFQFWFVFFFHHPKHLLITELVAFTACMVLMVVKLTKSMHTMS